MISDSLVKDISLNLRINRVIDDLTVVRTEIEVLMSSDETFYFILFKVS